MVRLELREKEQPRLIVLLLEKLHPATGDTVDTVLIFGADVFAFVIPIVALIQMRDQFEHIRALPQIIEATPRWPGRNPPQLTLAPA